MPKYLIMKMYVADAPTPIEAQQALNATRRADAMEWAPVPDDFELPTPGGASSGNGDGGAGFLELLNSVLVRPPNDH